MENEHSEYSIEQQLSCIPLDALWEEKPLPTPNDVFTGHPVAAQRMAFVDMNRVHQMLNERDQTIAALSQKLLHANSQINAGTHLRNQLFDQINYKREVCAAQTMFLSQVWGRYPNWSREDAHRAMHYYVEEALSHRPTANRLLRGMLETEHKKNTKSEDDTN